jgi:hypothetical protein
MHNSKVNFEQKSLSIENLYKDFYIQNFKFMSLISLDK